MSNTISYGTNSKRVSIFINVDIMMQRMSRTYNKITESSASYLINEKDGNLTGAIIEDSMIQYYSEKLMRDYNILKKYMESRNDITWRQKNEFSHITDMVCNVRKYILSVERNPFGCMEAVC